MATVGTCSNFLSCIFVLANTVCWDSHTSLYAFLHQWIERNPFVSYSVQFIVSVVGIVNHASAPHLPDSVEEAVAPPHKPWCHLTWSHVIPTLRYWMTLLEDLQVRGYFKLDLFYVGIWSYANLYGLNWWYVRTSLYRNTFVNQHFMYIRYGCCSHVLANASARTAITATT